MQFPFFTIPLYNGSYKQFIRASGISRGKTWNVSESFRFSAFSYVNFDVEYDPQSSLNHIWRWLYIYDTDVTKDSEVVYSKTIILYWPVEIFHLCFVTNVVMKTIYTNTIGWQQWLNVKERYIATTFWSIIKGLSGVQGSLRGDFQH